MSQSTDWLDPLGTGVEQSEAPIDPFVDEEQIEESPWLERWETELNWDNEED